MKTSLACIPCFVRQALDSARMVTEDETVHERVLREVLRATGEVDLRCSPPQMGQWIHRLIRKATGDPDPYLEVKRQFNRLALELYPQLEAKVIASDDPLAAAVRLAIAGNIIDFGVTSDLRESHVTDTIAQALEEPLNGDIEALREAIDQAERILFLADNAGEIVLDRLLIEQLPREKVTVVVKGSPVINDATMDDARVAGLCDRVAVIDNGSDAPGTILSECSEAFARHWEAADLVLAKGQGNYETLSEVDKNIFFLLKAKCPVIAEDLGCTVGSLVARRADEAPAEEEDRYARA